MLVIGHNPTQSQKAPELAAVAEGTSQFSTELLVEPEDRQEPDVSAVFRALRRVDPTPAYKDALRRRQKRRELAEAQAAESMPTNAASFFDRLTKSLAFWRTN